MNILAHIIGQTITCISILLILYLFFKLAEYISYKRTIRAQYRLKTKISDKNKKPHYTSFKNFNNL